MFLIGTLMGIGTDLIDSNEGHLAQSVQQWTNIDAEVLLLGMCTESAEFVFVTPAFVFLPIAHSFDRLYQFFCPV